MQGTSLVEEGQKCHRAESQMLEIDKIKIGTVLSVESRH